MPYCDMILLIKTTNMLIYSNTHDPLDNNQACATQHTMTKVYIQHETLPVSYKSKPALKRWSDTLIGMFYYTTPSFVMTRFENCVCSVIGLVLVMLFVYGCKNYVLPLFYLLKQLF
ncbi:hypothetical protein PICMEDRAFT_74844 [Pichia membranifaciens NRRL Y-2026]|uniref:Uncharacterized protein n=1 Tax=Pichia membranifaciens NRRL Y-2026 TaxID=763406 RepID=A0A1E3NDN2_9ASCO|nr:hypothetical protein PICMEDRAFT_74844 [Pichia membranifaciens NRRL Y-2026]ODQ44237.1 hypothetical protein PICMEDRAFT_74844 [Pichia membranifaciens NRRL Y-2026]